MSKDTSKIERKTYGGDISIVCPQAAGMVGNQWEICGNFKGSQKCHYTVKLKVVYFDQQNNPKAIYPPATVSGQTFKSSVNLSATPPANMTTIVLYYQLFLDAAADTDERTISFTYVETIESDSCSSNCPAKSKK